MFTLAICLSFISVFCLYSLAQKVEVEPKGLMLFLKSGKMLTRALGGLAFLLSTFIYIGQMGFAVGIFTGLLFWMLLSCLMILFTPFGKVKWGHLTFGVLVIGGIEMSVLFL
ncbi:hypothetical protein [Algoriphagus sp. Y33]|uniref:hypothetical protein n=1 Tax=Algoriphagus sp. Y33 TaxID=2772483 RepID=UPI001780B271|nr:hypothetical protein [Algoriphagus sp. Y33]